MTPERLQKINDVFQSAVELDSEKVEAYLDEACADDKSLREQVESLLAANMDAGTFIAGNAANDVGHLLTLKDSPTLTGESLGHYEIISVLGSGGMGRVYLAKDPKLNRSIAVKTLPNSLSGKTSFVKRFQTEARAAANLNHPNVATVYSVEETDDSHVFITMEYVEGKPLNQSIPEGGLDLMTFLEWFIPLSDALTHAHEKGIVHRDIKPSNVMVTPAGTPKILDFGLARIDKKTTQENASTLSLTKTGQVLGTPAYMSPEQAEGKQSDHRTDIFSFGVVMYEAITGRRPFRGESYASIVSELLTKEPEEVAGIKPEVPAMLSRLIMKCLRKEPRRRYQSMNEVRVILKEINSALNSGTSLSSAEKASISRSRSISPSFLYALAGALVALAGVGVWTWFSPRAGSTEAIARFLVTPPKSARLNILNSEISRDGKKLLFRSFLNEGDKFYIRSLDTFENKPVSGTVGGKTAFFSPDGKWVAFSTKSDSIRKVPVEGGTPLSVCDVCPTNRNGYWGDDNFIYFSQKDGLFRVSADGGKPERLTTLRENEKEHFLPQLLPNGEGVIFTVTRTDQKQLGLLNLSDGTWDYITEAGRSWWGKYISSGHIVFARGKQLMALAFDPSSLKVRGKPVLAFAGLFEMAPNIAVADNGTLIYLQTISRTDNQLVWVDRTGQESPALEKKGDFSSPRISPDGGRVVVTLGNDVWVYDLKTGGGIRITDEGKNQIPMWSPDGKSVIYTTERNEKYYIHQKNADGASSATVIHESKNRLVPYSFHPDDRVLALSTVDHSGNSDIMMKALNEDKTQTLIATKFKEDTPRFSSDGSWLAYFSMDTGQPQIYVQSWQGEKRKIPITKKGGMFPVWSPKGNELFYRYASTINSVDVNSSGSFTFSDPRTLFSGRYLTSFDVAPDGNRFLMVKDEHGTLPGSLHVVLNWTSELKQKVGSSN